MRRLKTMAILGLLAVLVGSIALATTSSETDVRISARQLEDGRVEVGLQQRVDGEWGERALPRSRYFPADATVNRWLNSTPMIVSVIATDDLTERPTISVTPQRPNDGESIEVRVAARQIKDGRVEFALQQRVDGVWGERTLPHRRYFPANAAVNRWLSTAAVTVNTTAVIELQAQQQQPTQQEGDGRKEPIVFSNLNWTSAEVQNQIVSYIVHNGYGYPVDLFHGNIGSLWQWLLNGDAHVMMEIWPGQQQWIDKLEDDSVIALLGDSLDDHWEGWVIPQYVKDENPGLVSVTDIPEYAELFATTDSLGKARFFSCIASWSCARVNEEKFDSYGLRDSLHIITPSSGVALFASLEAMYDRGDAWLGYIWGPTKPTQTLDLYRLEEPEWTAECWESGKACAYPTTTVRIAVAAELLDRAPDIVEFLRAWDFKAREYIGTDIWMSDNNETPEAAALYYLRTYRDVWTAFVPDDIAAKVDAALADAG